MIRLLDGLRELFPDLLLTFGEIERMTLSSETRERIASVRTKTASLLERVRHLEEGSDCMPAAEAGRQQNQRS